MFLVFQSFAFLPFHFFFKPFPEFSYGFPKFPSCNFLIFPTVSSIFLGFSKLAIHFFLHFHVFFFNMFFHCPFFCNPSPLLPRQHSSSPCKPSCSEPQRTLLSVELRILSFFNMFASMFLVFSKLCLSSISFIFQTFSCVPTVFPEFPSCNFFIFPTVSSISLVFPSLPVFSSILMFFFHNFPPFSSIFLRF